jgi:2-hydroxychromene-2-carboxylate isomerase
VELSCYYDLTCAYSYRAWTWIDRQRAAGRELEVDWRPFVLKEVNRTKTEPSLLAGSQITSVAVLALAIAEALRGDPQADAYRSATFHAMHAGEDRPDRHAILTMAEDAGLDVAAFEREESAWLGAVQASHVGALALGVFGTPTLFFPEGRAMYLKLTALPPDRDEVLWDALTTVTTGFPEVIELKRPQIKES